MGRGEGGGGGARVSAGCTRLRPRTIRLRGIILNTLVVSASTFSMMSRVLGPRAFCSPERRGVCRTVRAVGVRRHPISVVAIASRLAGVNTVRGINKTNCLVRVSSRITSTTRVRCRTQVLTRGCLRQRLVRCTNSVRARTCSRNISISRLVRRTRNRLFRLSRNGVGRSCARVSPIVGSTISVLRHTTRGGNKLANVPANCRRVSSVASN